MTLSDSATPHWGLVSIVTGCATRSRERAHSLCDSSSQASSARTTLLVKQRADYSFFAGPLRVGDFDHGHCIRGWLNSELELDV